MATIGERLRIAIRRMPARGRERGIRLFQKQMEERYPGVTGTSYPSIHSYLQNRTAPPLEFLAAAAELLGVREEWLANGEGEMTEERQRIMKAAPEPVEEDIDDVLEEAFPGYKALPAIVQYTFADVLGRAAEAQMLNLASQLDGRRVLPNGYIRLMAAEFGKLLMLPTTHFGFGPMDTGSREFTDYALAMLHALSLAITGPGKAEPMESLIPEED